MLPAILLFFFIPALLTTPTHPYIDAPVPRVSTLLPDIKEIHRAVDHIINHVHKYGLIQILEEQDKNNHGEYYSPRDALKSEIKWAGYNRHSDHERGYCYYYSFYIVDQLTKFGYKAQVIGNSVHAYVEVWTIEGIVIIDATYRQFFPWRNHPEVFDLWGMPEILIIKRRDFERVIYSFPIQPSFGWPIARRTNDHRDPRLVINLGFAGAYGTLEQSNWGKILFSENYFWQMISSHISLNGFFTYRIFNPESEQLK